jgi:hypothetical protein
MEGRVTGVHTLLLGCAKKKEKEKQHLSTRNDFVLTPPAE